MNELKIAIVGAGGVGGYLAAKLVQNMYDVTLVVKDKHYKVIKEKGLKVSEYKDEEFIVKVDVVKELNDNIFDIVIIATKTYDFDLACKSIYNGVDENTLIIPLSNGVEHKKTLQENLPKSKICDGAIYIISKLEAPGFVSRNSFTFYLLFGSDKEEPNLKVLESILNGCELRTNYTANIKYECWKKYLFIASMAALTTYYDQPMGYIVKEKLEEFVQLLVQIQQIANKKGIELSNNDLQKAVKQATHVPYESKTSMQLDFEKGKKSELESLCGFLVKEAKALNITIETMEKIYNHLKNYNMEKHNDSN